MYGTRCSTFQILWYLTLVVRLLVYKSQHSCQFIGHNHDTSLQESRQDHTLCGDLSIASTYSHPQVLLSLISIGMHRWIDWEILCKCLLCVSTVFHSDLVSLPLPERPCVFCHQRLWELIFPCSLYAYTLCNSIMFLNYWPMSFQSPSFVFLIWVL